ncbi:uncharacterized protein EHS24_002216 [Apiotrichum porosum]|uniref:Uncharacterized protein n=1 Tax=Apiotrichum porosum TaxID=105984 RepID=A0A427XHX7_9TREE|nr:uncharacterized protein EHS24_002216 [Apiotrichum porosum]RSH78491.1 hypothetical protein EHS24_002216 [Apiotrichum porosum]
MQTHWRLATPLSDLSGPALLHGWWPRICGGGRQREEAAMNVERSPRLQTLLYQGDANEVCVVVPRLTPGLERLDIARVHAWILVEYGSVGEQTDAGAPAHLQTREWQLAFEAVSTWD